MIDGLFKRHIDPVWENLARPLAAIGLHPNGVTLLGLCLVLANAAAYFWHRSQLLFGIGLAISFAADSLDGAVARLRHECTLFGSYLDAMVDRYQESIVLLTIGYINAAWLPAGLALAGSLLTSYAKARVAIEVSIDNNDWPDLFERQERVIFLCGLLVFGGIAAALFGLSIIVPGLWIFAVLTHFTAVQRMMRARKMLVALQDRT